MIRYEVKNVTNKDDLYQTYYLKFDNDISCYYYEAKNNLYVNEVNVVMEGYKIEKIDNSMIYLFLKKTDDINSLKYILDYFNGEYDNLIFNYLGFSENYYNDINMISRNLNLHYKIKENDNEYVERRNNTGNNSYTDYDLSDNVLIRKDEEDSKVDIELFKDSANYNGYNKGRIDKNVKNIVNYNFNKRNNN